MSHHHPPPGAVPGDHPGSYAGHYAGQHLGHYPGQHPTYDPTLAAGFAPGFVATSPYQQAGAAAPPWPADPRPMSPNVPPTASPPQAAAPMPQPPGAPPLFGFANERFVKGLLIGAAAAYVLSNESVQHSLIKGAVRLWTGLQGGLEEVKERFQDAEAELQAAAAAPDD